MVADQAVAGSLAAQRTTRTPLRLSLVCALLLAGLATPALASNVRPMTLEEMTERAGRKA